MSSSNKTIPKRNEDFIERFIEVCGTSAPKEIAGLLEISYQTAQNYLNGRLPDSTILIKISEKTIYSLNWLLTGKGRKFVDKTFEESFEELSRNIKRNVSPELIRDLNTFFGEFDSKKGHAYTASRKTVKLSPDKIREQKENNLETINLLENQD